MKSQMIKCVAGLALVAGTQAASAALTVDIDTFSAATSGLYPYQQTAVSPLTSPGVDSPVSGVIGGGRVVSLSTQLLQIPGLDNISAGVFAGGPGVFDYNSTAGADGFATLAYGDYQNALAPLNLSIPGGSFAQIDLLAFDRPEGGVLTAFIRMESTGVGSAQTFVSTTTAGAQSLLIPLEGIAPQIRANVTNIVVTLDTTMAVDFRIDRISVVVPEPGMVSLLVPAGVLALRRSRR